MATPLSVQNWRAPIVVVACQPRRYTGVVADHPRIGELVAVIEEGIACRGFYVLMNDRLDWICGKGCSEDFDDSKNVRRIKAFAARHKWSATLEGAGVCFRPRE
jgi:hypothetical protein